MATIRNEADRAKLIERIGKLNGDESPIWGKMNVKQMVSHLVQNGDLPFVASLPDKSNFMSRAVIKPLILYVLPMPKEIKSGPEMDQQENGRRPLEFKVDKNLLIQSIDRLGAVAIDHNCLHHPFFGKMTAKEWGRIAHKHIDHHLRQFGV
jgi:Protein of unknown function (DUF1569)